MSSFLVVKTNEDGKIFLTTVPANWCDGKTLYFPNSGDWKTLRKNKIPPELDWKKYPCQVKGKYNKLEDALQAEKRFANFEDTEDEERYLTNLKEKRAHPGRVLTSKIENNLNERLRELSSQHSVITNTNSSNEDTSSSEMDTYENDIADETLVENSQQNNVVHSENLSEDILLLNLPNVATSIEELKEDILKLNAKADKILDILLNKVTVVKNTAFLNLHPDNPEVVEENIFPIKSLEALNTLNEKLSELNFFKSIIKQFDKEYIGTGYTWKKIAYLLIDKLIERQVLKLFTWTGSSKKQSIKFSFSALIHFNRLFYGIVKAGDQAYTQLNHEDFFKHSILKYSDARATAADKGLKRTSTPRVSVSRKKTTINLSLEDPIEVAQEDKENADLQDEDRISESE